jgi:transposase
MLHAPVAGAWPKVDWSEVTCVGCDELSAGKGHRYVSVFYDLIGKRVLFATPGKDKSTREKLVEALGAPNSHLRAWCRWVRWVAVKHLLALFSSFIKTAAMIESH